MATRHVPQAGGLWHNPCMLAAHYFGYDVPNYWLGILLGGNVVWAIIGYFLAGTKNNGCWGCGLGCILGPFGLLISMLIPDQRNR